jgi:prepilin-type N-terminal cleavage/methylation domain-containing protein
MLHRRSGFTLIELMLAIAIAIIILMMAMPSLRGLSKEQKLQETFERFDALARKAQANAVAQQRAWTLVWAPGTITLQPDEPTPEERLNATTGDGSTVETLSVGPDENYSLDRPVALLPLKDQEPEWTFWRSGTCEPVIVSYSGPNGTWTAQYHPLTGHGEITDQRLP